jgi:protein TonB
MLSAQDEKGRQLDSSLCVEKESTFPRRRKKLEKFFGKNLNPEVPIKNRAPEGTYTVMVQFVVDKEGRVYRY